jgi:hypothetical protein
MSQARTYQGGCHCGAVRYEVDLDLTGGASRCNCTICTMKGAIGVTVKPDAFRLLAGDDKLTDYTRPGNPNHHLFCKVCGIHSFGRGDLIEVGGDYYSINLNCLADFDPARLALRYWDGRHNNWEAGQRDEPWPILD